MAGLYVEQFEVGGLFEHEIRRTVTEGTTIANLGMSEVTFPNPVFASDTIRSRTTILEKRNMRSSAVARVRR
jgi:acyl dehydratase